MDPYTTLSQMTTIAIVDCFAHGSFFLAYKAKAFAGSTQLMIAKDVHTYVLEHWKSLVPLVEELIYRENGVVNTLEKSLFISLFSIEYLYRSMSTECKCDALPLEEFGAFLSDLALKLTQVPLSL